MLKWNRLKVNVRIFGNKWPVIENILENKIAAPRYYYYEKSNLAKEKVNWKDLSKRINGY